MKNLKQYFEKYPLNVNKETFFYFIDFLYKNVSLESLNYTESDLIDIAENLYQFIIESKKRPDIKIYVNKESTYIAILSEDAPFVMDAIASELIENGLTIKNNISNFIPVSRDLNSSFCGFNGESNEVLIYIELSCILCEKDMKELSKRFYYIIESIGVIEQDREKMFDAICDGIDLIVKNSKKFFKSNLNEIINFMEWIKDDNFIPMTYIEYDFHDSLFIERKQETSLGMASMSLDDARHLNDLPSNIQSLIINNSLIDITKSERISISVARKHMTSISIKKIDSNGNIVGIKILTGVFSPIAYSMDVVCIPIIGKKIKNIVNKLIYKFSSKDYLLNEFYSILEFFPIDILFYHSSSYLFNAFLEIILKKRNPNISILVDVDRLQRFVSCIVLMPKKMLNNNTAYVIANVIENALNVKFLGYDMRSDLDLISFHMEFKSEPGNVSKIKIEYIKNKIKSALFTPKEKFDDLANVYNKANLNNQILFDEYVYIAEEYRTIRNALSDNLLPEDAIEDIVTINKMYELFNETSNDCVNVSVRKCMEKNCSAPHGCEIFLVKLYRCASSDDCGMNKYYSIMNNIGAEVFCCHGYSIKRNVNDSVSFKINYFFIYFDNVCSSSKKCINVNFILSNSFVDSMRRIFSNQIVNDCLNKLIIFNEFGWRELLFIRSIVAYLKQIRFEYTNECINNVFNSYPDMVLDLFELFEAKFNPFILKREIKLKQCYKKINEKVDKLGIMEERVISTFLSVINATVRTNFYQANSLKNYVSYKIKSSEIDIISKPKPFFEIFVFSHDMEGVHLRGGKIARGGIRWSDRIEDYRTEVLGLMRAQITKNTVIVPTGAKGGFVIKLDSIDGVTAYKKLLYGMLDITDNVVGENIIYPLDAVLYDESDTYLTVAADKGTATFSDHANAIAAEYNFWLGDAFASGGSAGYDHKKLGITARGAWISVMHHLGRCGIDVKKDYFTVVGIGDMSGDVFGNGMLLSDNIKLIAAFDHRHIFIDPSPDPKASFLERKRLFAKKNSSWNDYEKNTISAGGGVFNRNSNIVKLSQEAMFVLGTKKKACTTDELISIILKANVDLIWNGGIGTYVKSCHEANEMVGDRFNDSLRVNGFDISAKAFVEGGNLGVTQKGRIEYSKNGGLINADFIDNSAGVSCSDHEVNIKIVFNEVIDNKKITIEERNKILILMQDDVSELVLIDNFEQNMAIYFAELQAKQRFESDLFLIDGLEEDGYLNVEFESLPSKKEADLMLKNGDGLSRPQICILLSYVKLAIYDKLFKSNIADDLYLEKFLINYFPKIMREEFLHEIKNHKLRKEIITTYITNNIANYAGQSFLSIVSEVFNVGYREIALAYIAVKEIYNIDVLFNEIVGSINNVADKTKILIIRDFQFFIEHTTSWFLRNYSGASIGDVVSRFYEPVNGICEYINEMFTSEITKIYKKRKDSLIASGINVDLANKISLLKEKSHALDIVEIHLNTGVSIQKIGFIYFLIDSALMIDSIMSFFSNIMLKSYWKKLVIKTIFYQMRDKKIKLINRLIQSSDKDSSPEDVINKWMLDNKEQVSSYICFMQEINQEIKNGGQPNIDMLHIAVERFGLL